MMKSQKGRKKNSIKNVEPESGDTHLNRQIIIKSGLSSSLSSFTITQDNTDVPSNINDT